MTSPERQRPPSYAKPIIGGLIVVAVGLAPWMWLAHLNLRVRPDLPWAAIATLAYLAVLVLWLNGSGPPRGTGAERRRRLRLWPPGTPEAAKAGGLSAAAVVGLLVLLYVAMIGIARLSPMPDLGAYPTTSYRWSMFLMGAFTAGLVEEVAFRGYMQGGIERFDRRNALWITSLAFAASHVTQGVGALLLLGPGLFAASMLYGVLARRTGTIVPGIAIHVLGDLSYMFFGVLRGDVGHLFAG